MNPEDQCNIALCFDSDTDCWRYNLPTATEIAVILPGDGDQPTNTCDIILWHRGGGSNVKISEMHPFYYAQNPIPAKNQDEDQDGQVVVPSKKHKYLSQTEYFCY